MFCQWELTCRCNLRCVMCYTDCFNTPEKVRTELTTSEILRIMDEMKEAGLAELCLTGGEPFARPDFFEIYEHAVRGGLIVTIFTNGTLITEEVADRLAALPPFSVEISLHGTSAGTFEQVTLGKGSFDKCMKGIELLTSRRIPLLLKVTAMTVNHPEVLAVKKYAMGLEGVKFKMNVRMQPDLEGSTAPSQYELTEHEIDRLFEKESKLAEEACESRCREASCASGKYKFHIDAYGQMQLCSGNRRGGYDLRNGSFKEGFEKVLPTLPCPFKPKLALQTVDEGLHV